MKCISKSILLVKSPLFVNNKTQDLQAENFEFISFMVNLKHLVKTGTLDLMVYHHKETFAINYLLCDSISGRSMTYRGPGQQSFSLNITLSGITEISISLQNVLICFNAIVSENSHISFSISDMDGMYKLIVLEDVLDQST